MVNTAAIGPRRQQGDSSWARVPENPFKSPCFPGTQRTEIDRRYLQRVAGSLERQRRNDRIEQAKRRDQGHETPSLGLAHGGTYGEQ